MADNPPLGISYGERGLYALGRFDDGPRVRGDGRHVVVQNTVQAVMKKAIALAPDSWMPGGSRSSLGGFNAGIVPCENEFHCDVGH